MSKHISLTTNISFLKKSKTYTYTEVLVLECPIFFNPNDTNLRIISKIIPTKSNK